MSDDDTYEIPLQDQRVFGAGIKRKRVKFVPSSTAASSTSSTLTTRTGQSISNLYLSLVLPKQQPHLEQSLGSSESRSTKSTVSETAIEPTEDESTQSEICEICNLPFSTSADTDDAPTEDADSSINSAVRSKPRPHEASLAHQVCLTHSHPPSHLDRNRKGLTYLSAYGWDPDSRLGLGASGQGIQFPIKPKPKDDKLGIGVVLPKEADRRRKEKPTKLDAGKVRKLHEKDRKASERLREMFYRNDDVERYLGGG